MEKFQQLIVESSSKFYLSCYIIVWENGEKCSKESDVHMLTEDV
jgi:hypothetical protein